MSKTIFENSRAGRKGYTLPKNDIDVKLDSILPDRFKRKESAELPEVSELDAMRHFLDLAHKNHSVDKGFYPLGSCTMKYNPKVNEVAVRNSGLGNVHPYQPEESVQGALEIMHELQSDLAEISGMANVTLQPVAGAQGEFVGLKLIAAYHKAKGNTHKDTIIMPDSAHGTNPASCSLAGFKVVELASNEHGKVDIEHLRELVDENTAGFMLTNPNTLGLFEGRVEEIAEIIHSVDGLMYMDGANLNALLGIVQPGKIGFDVLHFNLHKTFSTPHGGGGPGSGPVGVVETLLPYLPVPMVDQREDGTYYLDYRHQETSIGKVHTFFGNFAVNVRAFVYIKMLGAQGIRAAGENAVLNANYLQARLAPYYNIQYKDTYCMHEFVADATWQKEKYGVITLDIAKRLLDNGMHAPTVYFPLIIKEAMMIEPTETESKETLDEFVDVMIKIAKECETDADLLHHAPISTPVRRVDDVLAARKLNVRYVPED